ncbi:MAG: Ig-like domain-containing protein [Candidatus Sericytochromatia bacterium]
MSTKNKNRLLIFLTISAFLTSCNITLQSEDVQKLANNINNNIAKSVTPTATPSVAPKVNNLILATSKTELNPGDYLTLDAKVLYNNETMDKNITWQSSRNDIILVHSDGSIRAIQSGKATITAISKIDNTFKKSVEITVKNVPFFIKVYAEDGTLISSNDPKDNRIIRAYNFEVGQRPKFIVKTTSATGDLKINKNINVLVTLGDETIIRALNKDSNNEDEKVFFVEGINFGEARIRIELKDFKENFIQFPIGFRKSLKEVVTEKNPCEDYKTYTRELYPQYFVVYQDSSSYTYPYSGDALAPAIYTGATGVTSDIRELATFNGRVYDTSGVPVDGATVTAKSVDPSVIWSDNPCYPNINWVGEAQQTQSGAYVFRNAPVGVRLEITVKKDGWTTRTRTEVLKSNLQGDPNVNVFEFGVKYQLIQMQKVYMQYKMSQK